MCLVRGGGLEPPHHCWRQDLNLVRLPISPPALRNHMKGRRCIFRPCAIGQPGILTMKTWLNLKVAASFLVSRPNCSDILIDPAPHKKSTPPMAGDNAIVNTPIPAPLAAQALANSHYENFPVASWLCPAQLRPPIAAIYAFARTADDLADEGTHSPAQRLADLALYRQDLHACAQGQTSSGPWSLRPWSQPSPSTACPWHCSMPYSARSSKTWKKPAMAQGTPRAPSCWIIAAARPTPWDVCCCTCMASTMPRLWNTATPFARHCSSLTSGKT